MKFSLLSQGWQLKLVGSVAIVGTLLIPAKESLAQIVPDTTLGVENSVVTPNLTIRGIQSDRIDGGAIRGINLFHSFQEFNVEQGRGTYFANPTGVENILTRVTGNNPSNIFGRLGVLGGADLFLLNPNGIVFGSTASLDIQGSFLATTADRIQLGDIGYFSASQPQTSRLLSVSPGALFFNAVANQPTSIINRGNLSTGKHLTLAAGNLDLQGQLFAGGDLTLQAQDTVKVRDSAAIPFIASAGESLLVQGSQGVDIFALTHPESGLFSGGDMVLRSSKTVGGDAHYWSKGSFRIEQLDGSLGNLFSPYDPIIRAAGDVFINAYQGASLHILAGGKVEIPGYVWIQGADPQNGLVETVSLADGTNVSINGKSEPTLDIRAGVNPNIVGNSILTLPGTGIFVQPVYGTSSPSSADIGIGTILFADRASQALIGRVLLTNQYQPNLSLSGDIQVTQNLQAGLGAIVMDGGAANSSVPSVAINSSGSIALDGTVRTSLSPRSGGAILLSALGNVSTRGLTTSGGAINISSAGSITTNGQTLSTKNGDDYDAYLNSSLTFESPFTTYPGSGLPALQGGAIRLFSANGNITTGNLDSYSLSVVNTASQGEAIRLETTNGSITTGNLRSSSSSSTGSTGQGGAIQIQATGGSVITGKLDSRSSSSFGSVAGTGGAIQIQATGGSISTGNLASGASSNSKVGAGGKIRLRATGGSITTGNLASVSSSNFGDAAGMGGAIQIQATGGNISTNDLTSGSYSGSSKAGTGGAIQLQATGGNISTGNLDSVSSSLVGNADTGGAIQIQATGGNISTGNLRSDSLALFGNGNAGTGGAIQIQATGGNISTDRLSSGSSSFVGNAGTGGAIQLQATGGSILTAILDSGSYSRNGNVENGGAINLSAANDINIEGDLNSFSYARNGNAGSGGAISSSAANDINIKGNLNSFSYAMSGIAGEGGAISLRAKDGNISGVGDRSTVLGSFSIAEQGTAGNGGNVALEAKNNVSNLEVLTLSSDSQSGKVQVTGLKDLLLTNTNILTSKQVTVVVRSLPPITLNVGGKGQSGDVDVASLGNLTFNNSSIQSDTKGSDRAGNVTISSPSLVTFNHSFIRSNTTSTGTAGSIGIEAGQGVTIVGMDDFSPVLSVETSSAGQPGNIIISTPSLTLSNNARITATATNTATNPLGGGSIALNASTMNLAGVVGVFAETQGQTPAGTLTLRPYENQSTLNLTLAPQSLVSASTSGSGKGGNLTVQAPEAITIRGKGQLAVQTTGDGAAGDLRIETQRLTLADGATLSASTASKNSNGVGGNLTINATESFSLTNQARLLAQSTGAAPAGNITIQTGRLTANNGTIVTSSNQSSGGGITIAASNIRLFGNSDITSRVDSGAGGGGNIYLKAGSILAFGDSDILAFSRDGRGGNITLDTRAFFGQNYRPAPRGTDPRTLLDSNNRVDLNATGTISSGIIIQPDTSFIQNSLTELPGNQIDTDNILASSCIVRRNQPTQGRFTITGAGGLPQRPGDVQMSSFPTIDIETLPSDSTASTTNPDRPWQKGDPIVEPQGVYKLPNGKLLMSRECP